ncbi:MAG TPA: PAS domain-containing protein, partial [Pyrinomonadaceae bacterium]|nr:PAS domain-containing protein [Pyrinomonadaceae bacterium]
MKRRGSPPKPALPERQMPTFLELESLNISLSPNEGDPSFRTIFEYLPVMCYVTEPEPPFAPIYVSSPTIEAFGYSLEEWRTNADLWINAIHEDDRAGIIEKSDVARFSNAEFNEQYRLVAADGTVRWIHDRGRFVRDSAGNLVCWIGIMMDITDGQKAQLQLLANEESYKSIFEDANDIIYVHDLNGNYLWMNR